MWLLVLAMLVLAGGGLAAALALLARWRPVVLALVPVAVHWALVAVVVAVDNDSIDPCESGSGIAWVSMLVLGTVFVLGPVFAHRARGRGVLAFAWLLVSVPAGAVVFGFGLLTVLGHGGCFE
jgi:hypothetical protein